jgi:hypothetical protein
MSRSSTPPDVRLFTPGFTAIELEAWLRSAGFPAVAAIAMENELDGADLAHCNITDFRELQISDDVSEALTVSGCCSAVPFARDIGMPPLWQHTV